MSSLEVLLEDASLGWLFCKSDTDLVSAGAQDTKFCVKIMMLNNIIVNSLINIAASILSCMSVFWRPVEVTGV